MMAALRHHARAAGALATLLLAGGCMVGPDYHRPAAVLSLRYKELAGWVPAKPSDMAAKGAWWRIYNDPRLNALEARVSISNQNVATYAAQYVEAQAAVQEARAVIPNAGRHRGHDAQ
jgi:outer membrane protein TolC